MNKRYLRIDLLVKVSVDEHLNVDDVMEYLYPSFYTQDETVEVMDTEVEEYHEVGNWEYGKPMEIHIQTRVICDVYDADMSVRSITEHIVYFIESELENGTLLEEETEVTYFNLEDAK